ncbi:MAG TPA: hypothetical protein PKI32_00580 [Opitutales bacterium]|nr:hypothetical protein [Opitutales bacterium]
MDETPAKKAFWLFAKSKWDMWFLGWFVALCVFIGPMLQRMDNKYLSLAYTVLVFASIAAFIVAKKKAAKGEDGK